MKIKEPKPTIATRIRDSAMPAEQFGWMGLKNFLHYVPETKPLEAHTKRAFNYRTFQISPANPVRV